MQISSATEPQFPTHSVISTTSTTLQGQHHSAHPPQTDGDQEAQSKEIKISGSLTHSERLRLRAELTAPGGGFLQSVRQPINGGRDELN